MDTVWEDLESTRDYPSMFVSFHNTFIDYMEEIVKECMYADILNTYMVQLKPIVSTCNGNLYTDLPDNDPIRLMLQQAGENICEELDKFLDSKITRRLYHVYMKNVDIFILSILACYRINNRTYYKDFYSICTITALLKRYIINPCISLIHTETGVKWEYPQRGRTRIIKTEHFDKEEREALTNWSW